MVNHKKARLSRRLAERAIQDGGLALCFEVVTRGFWGRLLWLVFGR